MNKKCPKCNNETEHNAKFARVVAKKYPNKKKERPAWNNLVIGIIFIIIIKIISQFIPNFFIGIFISIGLPGIISWYLTKRYANNISEGIFKIISWSNIITWFIPIVGIMTSLSCLSFMHHRKDYKRKLFNFLGLFGLILTILNALIGGILGNL